MLGGKNQILTSGSHNDSLLMLILCCGCSKVR